MIAINQLIKNLESSEGTLITFHKKKKIEVTFSSLFPQIQKAAFYLKSKGLNAASVVGIIGRNDLEWIIADLACIYFGIKLLPLEINVNLEEYQSNDLRLAAVLISDDYKGQIDTIKDTGLPCFFFSELALSSEAGKIKDTPHVYHDKEVISYKSTSGSTGTPKIIGHSVQALQNSIIGTQSLFNHTNKDRILIFLPLSVFQQRYWLYSAIFYQFKIIVVPKEYVFIAIKQEQPTVLMGVPYIYEIIHEDFKSKFKKDPVLAKQYQDYIVNEKEAESFTPFLEYLGGNIRYLWTGSAPISKETLEFYAQMKIPLFQGYGTNETCIIAKNYRGNDKIGSVGKIFPNVEIKFDGNQQILVENKFPVCENYTIAIEEDQRSTFRKDGYIGTGDQGFIDDEGYLFINGRIKDMIALSTSKKVFPRSIEERIEQFTEIDNCVVYGDNKPYLVALLVPSSSQVQLNELQEIIENFNLKAKEEEKIYKFYTNSEKFSEQNNLVSSQNKIKRQQIYQEFHQQLESLYK